MALKKSSIFFLVGLLFACGCKFDAVYEDYADLPPNGWHKDSLARFSFVVDDTTSYFSLSVGVRNRGDYPYQNIWLFIHSKGSNGATHCDTFECFLANSKGEWYGTGFGDIHDLEVYYRKEVRFTQKGQYDFYIQHGMRDDVLEGVTNIGFKVSQIKSRELETNSSGKE